jgi:2-methylcitrate dehydratase PrpD
VSATELSRAVARFAATLSWDAVPAGARHAARRTVTNAVGLAVGANDHEVVRTAAAALRVLGVGGCHGVLGRAESSSATGAALLNGVAMHVEDFDDTHLRTVLHPGAPIVPAALAAAELVNASGVRALEGVVAGVELASRVGNGLGPGHFDRGWHVTGTVGHVGAAVAAGRVLRLSEERMLTAIAIAATQAAGHTEQLGSMTKALHPGKAAADGLRAAVLARGNLSAPARPLEGPRGMGALMSPELDAEEVLARLGDRWEIEDNAFKPYSCGIVSHPVIDAAVALRGRVTAADIASVEVVVRPVVLEVMGVQEPRNGLQSKFSVYHCFAVGLLDGAAGPAQYSDERALAPEVVALRRAVTATLDPDMPKDACRAVVVLRDGQRLVHEVAHATGSVDAPMTDHQLRAKFDLLVDPVLAGSTERLWDRVWGLEDEESLDALFRASRKGEE